MNDSPDATRYALDDDDLDDLLTGQADPGSPTLAQNPVASFFAEARTTAYAEHPRPDGRLSAVFSAVPGSGPSAAGAPAAPARGPMVDTGAPTTALPMSPAMAKATAGTAGGVAPAGMAGGPPPIADVPTLHSYEPGSAPSQGAPGGAVYREHVVYRPSTTHFLADALRPTPTKLLMVLSVMLVLFIGAQALGLVGDDSDQGQQVASVATVGDGSSTSTVPSTTATAPSSVVQSVSTTSAPATTIPAATQTTAGPSSTTTTPTISTTSTVLETTIESITTTPTEPPTTPTTPVESTVITNPTIPTTPTSDPTTTVPPTTTTVPVQLVVITPGVLHTVPQDIPAGFYSARVEGEAVCFAQMAHADGAEQTAVGQPGTNIQFRLFEGSTVITSVGCPQVYLPTPG